MEGLRHLGSNVYMAYVNVVKIEDPTVDTSTDAGRDEILTFAKNVFGDRFSPCP